MKHRILLSFFVWYLRSTIKQGGPAHRSDFHQLFGTILEEMETEFAEDSRISLKSYMKECIDELDCSYP